MDYDAVMLLCRREECGVDVILFSSCEEPPVTHSTPGIKRQQHTAGAAAASSSSRAGRASTAGNNANSNGSASSKRHLTMGLIGAAAALAVAGVAAAAAGSWLGCMALLMAAAATLLCWTRLSGSRSRFQSLWYKPVRAYVQGGYTISPREDCNGINSPECLVTCILKVSTPRHSGAVADGLCLLCTGACPVHSILKACTVLTMWPACAVQVDLRGFLGERSWLRPILDALGWVDAYVERMLMAVILVKDEVSWAARGDGQHNSSCHMHTGATVR
jgi:hypothetical protein